jgi:hypothetical protein
MGYKRTQPKGQRLKMAKEWLPTYEGESLVKGYRKKFAVDLLTAISDLQDLGVTLDLNYTDAVKKVEELRCKILQEKKQTRPMEQHDTEIFMYEEWDFGDGYNDKDVIGSHIIDVENRVDTFKKVGKNHIRVNGDLLQTNKKWSHLKQKQRDWIYEAVRTEHKKYIKENNQLPMKTGKRQLMAIIESKIDERGIWLPSHELERGVGKYIDKLNRKS